MRAESKETPIAIVAERLKRLPRRLRVAHLRALIGQQFPGSSRARQLAALLRDQAMPAVGERGGL